MIEAIVILLSVLLLIAYIKLGKNLTRPSIIYIGGFWVCSIAAYLWKEEWGLHKMSGGTLFMIVGGALLFFLVEWRDYRTHTLVEEREPLEEITPLHPISSLKLVLFFFFQLLSFYMLSRAKMAYAVTDDLATALLEINNDEKFNDTLVLLPRHVSYSYQLCRLAGYIWCILLPYYQFASPKYKKQKYLLALNLITIIIGIIFSGSRMGILYYLISYICFYYICYQYKNGWKWVRLPKKMIAVILSIGILFGILFQSLTSAVGREESDQSIGMYLAIYCGAQIKNLDDYIQYPFKQNNRKNLFAQYTISNIYNNIGQRQGSGQTRQYSAELPFNTYGSYPLGNVYSAYYNYYLDFGYWGILCAGLMSFFLAIIYRKMLQSKFWKTGKIDFGLIFYSWFIPYAFLCFFANEFWGYFSIEGMLKNLLLFWLFLFYLQGKESPRGEDLVLSQEINEKGGE